MDYILIRQKNIIHIYTTFTAKALITQIYIINVIFNV